LRALARRGASIASLVFLDLAGLALGLYIALVLRWLYYEHSVLWGVPWKAETTWLPFLMLVLLLVFWRNGLYSAREFRGGPVLGPPEALADVLRRHSVDELIVTDSDFAERELLDMAEEAHRRGVKVRIAPKTTELLTQRGDYVPGQGVPLFELRPPAFAGAQWAAKRAFDLSVSLLVVVLGLPFWLAIAAAVKLTSSGPVLFRDRRVGVGEGEFGMLK